MDPFNGLPWFVLKGIFSQLPDLPTLHRLHNASPAVAAFLHKEHGVFPDIVEAIISNYEDSDLEIPAGIKIHIRTLVLIWWRTYSISHPELHSEDNPLPYDYATVLSCLASSQTSCVISNPLPKTTPPIVLCRLLAMSTRIRQISHEFFHSLVSRCMALKPQHLQKPTRPQEYMYKSTFDFDPRIRPPGQPYTPIDIGPPTLTEERRLRHLMLKVILFFQLRNAVVAHGLFGVAEDAVESLQNEQVHNFWFTLPDYSTRAHQTLLTAIAWLDKEAGGEANVESWIASSSLTVSKRTSYCCREPTPLTNNDIELSSLGGVPPGYTIFNHCCNPRSPLRGIHPRVFAELGIFIWDAERLVSFGLLSTKSGRPLPKLCPDTWFNIASILTEDQWTQMMKAQRASRPE